MIAFNENQEPSPVIPEDIKNAWHNTLRAVEKLVRPQYFQSFILTIRLLELKDTSLILGFPDRFYRDWVHDHYSALIQEKFAENCPRKVQLEFSVEPKRHSPNPLKVPRSAQEPLSLQALRKQHATSSKNQARHSSLSDETSLNPKYGFETFVVGTSNQFAHAAAFTVGEAPGKHYNPLFIYGDVGLGKTHLLNAIGLKILEKFPQTRVHYTTFEKFTNHMIESIRIEKMDEFRDRYRKNCDVLIIDDIQFISGKERTQEEFFHTFNALYECQKQIVLSSDRAPNDIQGLEDRLRSRFEMGLIVDIQPPEMETRVAIIFKKSESDGINIPEEVAFYLAKLYRLNIRELEGALLKLSAFASLTGSEISIELAKKVLRQNSSQSANVYKDPEHIMKIVAQQYKISLADLKSDKKYRELSMPRQLAMFLTRKYSNLSLPDIGHMFGGKNHTTVLHAVRRISKLQDADPLLKESLVKLEGQIQELNPL